MPRIINVVKEHKCYGCEACYNTCSRNAIVTERNSCGFAHISVDSSKCIECGSCDRHCPALLDNNVRLKNEKYDQKVYSVRLKDKDIRRKSSSGGLFTALSDYILRQHGCVVGAVWNPDFSVSHTVALDYDLRDQMRQSKYVQSEIGNCYRDVKTMLESGRTVLFTGTPCQNAALKLYLHGTVTQNLILCDVLCGGNVSPGFFKDYLGYIESLKKDHVKSVCFRTKKLGWKQHHIRVELENSTYEGARRDNEPFFHLYLKKYIIRLSCFSCEFASTERISDLTLGDFWGIDKVDPSVDDDLGISFLSVNSVKGEELLNSVLEEVCFEERNINIAVPRQINLQHAPVKPNGYDEFWDDYCSRGAVFVLKRYTTFGFKNRLINNLKKWIRRFK